MYVHDVHSSSYENKMNYKQDLHKEHYKNDLLLVRYSKEYIIRKSTP